MPLMGSLALLGLATSALAEPRVLHMPMARNPTAHANSISKRSGDASVTIENDGNLGLYMVNASVGTPGQMVQLALDTGSSDIWFFGPNSCNTATANCTGGIYDPSKSSTVDILSPQGAFSIQYGTNGSNVTGNYITDDFSVGQASLKNLTMAYATYASYVPTGIMGIGFDTNEAITEYGTSPYPNFVDLLVSEGVTHTKAYSLWLNDLDSNTGNCLFGGYDKAKFSGELLTVPIQPDQTSLQLTSMTVAWTSLSIETGSGTTAITSLSLPSPALLDSGTTLMYVPMDIYDNLFNYFQAQDVQGDAVVQCSLLDATKGSLNFGFGGANGPVIKVPFSELALPLIGTDGQWLTFQDGSLACMLGIAPAGVTFPIILGDSFLRSAYVVYDLTNYQISLAQTVFNTTESNIVEISSASPIASVVSGVTVTQTATNNPGQIGSNPAATSTGGLNSIPLTASATNTGGSTNSIGILTASTASATSSSSSASNIAPVHAPVPGFMASVMVAGGSMLLGSVFFMLH